MISPAPLCMGALHALGNQKHNVFPSKHTKSLHFTTKKSPLCRRDSGVSISPGRTACKIVRGGVYVAHGAIFMKKNRYLADFAPGNPKDFSKIWRGWSWRGRCSPSTSVSVFILQQSNSSTEAVRRTGAPRRSRNRLRRGRPPASVHRPRQRRCRSRR